MRFLKSIFYSVWWMFSLIHISYRSYYRFLLCLIFIFPSTSLFPFKSLICVHSLSKLKSEEFVDLFTSRFSFFSLWSSPFFSSFLFCSLWLEYDLPFSSFCSLYLFQFFIIRIELLSCVLNTMGFNILSLVFFILLL